MWNSQLTDVPDFEGQARPTRFQAVFFSGMPFSFVSYSFATRMSKKLVLTIPPERLLGLLILIPGLVAICLWTRGKSRSNQDSRTYISQLKWLTELTHIKRLSSKVRKLDAFP